jgi:hypothetical protein
MAGPSSRVATPATRTVGLACLTMSSHAYPEARVRRRRVAPRDDLCFDVTKRSSKLHMQHVTNPASKQHAQRATYRANKQAAGAAHDLSSKQATRSDSLSVIWRPITMRLGGRVVEDL